MKKAVYIIPGGGVHVVSIPDNPGLDLWYKGIGCEMIEIVRPKKLADKRFVLVIDEEGLMKSNPLLNIPGSWYYGMEEHGAPIIGKAYIVKEVYGPEGPELAGLSEKEAEDLRWEIIANYYDWMEKLQAAMKNNA